MDPSKTQAPSGRECLQVRRMKKCKMDTDLKSKIDIKSKLGKKINFVVNKNL
jgi:hypothetical protein